MFVTNNAYAHSSVKPSFKPVDNPIPIIRSKPSGGKQLEQKLKQSDPSRHFELRCQRLGANRKQRRTPLRCAWQCSHERFRTLLENARWTRLAVEACDPDLVRKRLPAAPVAARRRNRHPSPCSCPAAKSDQSCRNQSVRFRKAVLKPAAKTEIDQKITPNLPMSANQPDRCRRPYGSPRIVGL